MQIRPLRQFITVNRWGRWQSLGNSSLTRNSAKEACNMATRLRASTSLENLGYEDSNKDCEMVKLLCKEGRLEEALHVLGLMNKHDPRTVSMAYVSILKACGNRKDVSDLKEVHAHIMQSKHCTDLFVTSTLISMYAKSGSLVDARKVFDSISVRDAVSWNTIIAGYAKQGNGKEALSLFSQMTQAGLKPDRVTFLLLLGACASLGDFEKGRQTHVGIVENGFDSHPFVATALVNMYAKCGSVLHAREVFDRMAERNVVAWTAMIAAYAKVGQGEPALTIWQQMKQEKVKPNKVTFICILNACAALGNLNKGKEIHIDIVRDAIQLDVKIGNSLIDMYSKCGSLVLAYEVFDSMNKKDVVSWTTLVAGYVKHGKYLDALNLFEEMKHKGLKPIDVTFACIFNACGSLAALDKGQHYHAEALEAGLELDVFLADALIDMYAKCGNLERARRIFDEMLMRDVVSWTAMIAGYTVHGQGMSAFQLFRQMQQENVRPNEITFLSVLSTCAHLGLIDEGCCLFDSMRKVYALTPTLVHHGCIVDILCRAGRLDEANKFINNMSILPDASIWMTLLGACNACGNVRLAESVFKCILELEPQDVEPYVILSNIYAAAGSWDKRVEVRRMMEARGALH